MKKLFAVLALALFLGGIGAPAFAVSQNSMMQIVLIDEEPKKKSGKSESEGCETGSKTGKTAKKDCSKKCGDKS